MFTAIVARIRLVIWNMLGIQAMIQENGKIAAVGLSLLTGRDTTDLLQSATQMADSCDESCRGQYELADRTIEIASADYEQALVEAEKTLVAKYQEADTFRSQGQAEGNKAAALRQLAGFLS